MIFRKRPDDIAFEINGSGAVELFNLLKLGKKGLGFELLTGEAAP